MRNTHIRPGFWRGVNVNPNTIYMECFIDELAHAAGKDPLEFVLEGIFLPIISHWVACFTHFGFILEPHAQNVLFEIDSEKSIHRIVYRDLNVGIDMRRRRALGIAETSDNTYNQFDPTSPFAI